ncbi:unnamed protein product [Durusdinium trenchii]|uniref:Uncharacterized protein n=1 Tax=Durusdinium trenchii TaxID=1381693 RepID=A0ABP0QBF7_9DINO
MNPLSLTSIGPAIGDLKRWRMWTLAASECKTFLCPSGHGGNSVHSNSSMVRKSKSQVLNPTIRPTVVMEDSDDAEVAQSRQVRRLKAEVGSMSRSLRRLETQLYDLLDPGTSTQATLRPHMLDYPASPSHDHPASPSYDHPSSPSYDHPDSPSTAHPDSPVGPAYDHPAKNRAAQQEEVGPVGVTDALRAGRREDAGWTRADVAPRHASELNDNLRVRRAPRQSSAPLQSPSHANAYPTRKLSNRSNNICWTRAIFLYKQALSFEYQSLRAALPQPNAQACVSVSAGAGGRRSGVQSQHQHCRAHHRLDRDDHHERPHHRQEGCEGQHHHHHRSQEHGCPHGVEQPGQALPAAHSESSHQQAGHQHHRSDPQGSQAHGCPHGVEQPGQALPAAHSESSHQKHGHQHHRSQAHGSPAGDEQPGQAEGPLAAHSESSHQTEGLGLWNGHRILKVTTWTRPHDVEQPGIAPNLPAAHSEGPHQQYGHQHRSQAHPCHGVEQPGPVAAYPANSQTSPRVQEEQGAQGFHHPNPDLVRRLEALEGRFRQNEETQARHASLPIQTEAPPSVAAPLTQPVVTVTPPEVPRIDPTANHTTPPSATLPSATPPSATLPSPTLPSPMQGTSLGGLGLTPPAGLTVEPMRLNSTLPSVGLPGRVSEAVPLTSENWKASRASLAATPGNGPGVSKLISPPRSPRGASPTHGGAQTPPMPAAWPTVPVSPDSPTLPWSPITGLLTPAMVPQPCRDQSPPSPSGQSEVPTQPFGHCPGTFGLRLPAPPGTLGRECFA